MIAFKCRQKGRAENGAGTEGQDDDKETGD